MRRDQRGAVLPSPVVVLSIIAVVMAAVVFVATRGGGETEREITPAARSEASPSATAGDPSGSATPSTDPSASATTTPEPPPIRRSKIYVEVYNNSSITGLASRVATTAGDAGWNVVGADNWYGTIPATTVYYPPRLQRAARVLATDLGIRRTAPAVDPMRMDRLTLILTGELR
ncbi:hypothetical protein GCM10022215_19970 [Nocardioides fonticola]|uniref:LytR/CpsA/Psr regulator C-terminal domain-containing protein n=1 Tax=Nocardioides fonticola TaxID=450363 RepID=A0ABP7XIB4_9ACTN